MTFDIYRALKIRINLNNLSNVELCVGIAGPVEAQTIIDLPIVCSLKFY